MIELVGLTTEKIEKYKASSFSIEYNPYPYERDIGSWIGCTYRTNYKIYKCKYVHKILNGESVSIITFSNDEELFNKLDIALELNTILKDIIITSNKIQEIVELFSPKYTHYQWLEGIRKNKLVETVSDEIDYFDIWKHRLAKNKECKARYDKLNEKLNELNSNRMNLIKDNHIQFNVNSFIDHNDFEIRF